MGELVRLSEKYNLKIIEDCAQAHGAKYHGASVGSIGDIAAFSFYPGKNLGAYGDGGAVTTNDRALASRVRMISNHGRLGKYDHEFEGRNSRLDGMQAAIFDEKLKHLERWTERRISVAELYTEGLRTVDGVILPVRQDWARQVYHLFVIRCAQREGLMSYLADHGVQTGVHYPTALPKLAAYAHINQQEESLFANESDSSLLSLPIGEHLSDSDVHKVVSLITTKNQNLSNREV